MPSRRAHRIAKEVLAIHEDNQSGIPSSSIKQGEKSQPVEAATGVSLKPEGIESLHPPEMKGPLCRTRDQITPVSVTESLPLRTGEPPSSNSMHKLNLPSLSRSPSPVLANFDTAPLKICSDSLADGAPAFVEHGYNASTTHMVPRYSVSENSSNQANRWSVMQWRRASREPLLPDVKAGNDTAITARTYLEVPREGHTNTDISASEISSSSSSSTTRLVGNSASGSGNSTNLAKSAETRKTKSPKHLERARERQKLARQAKRAAKTIRPSEGYTELDNDGIPENPEESVQDSKSREEDASPKAFSKLENDELQRSSRFENFALRASHERELERVGQLFEKQTHDNLRVLYRFLRLRSKQFFESLPLETKYDEVPHHVMASTLEKFISDSFGEVFTVGHLGTSTYKFSS